MHIALGIYVFFQALFFSLAVQAGEPGSQSQPQVKSMKTPRIEPLREADWNDKQAKLLAPFKVNGHVYNIFSTVARNPELLGALNPLGLYLLRGSSLPPRERELLILRIGWLTKSDYEFGQHTQIGLQVGLSKEEVSRVTQGPDAPGWNSFDATLLRAADELHRDTVITEATWSSLAEQYDDKQLMDMIVTVGQYRMLAMLLNSLQVPLDEGIPGFPGQ
jgi:alkylhydroperoxidase family enzyme